MRSALAARFISQCSHSTGYLHRSIVGPIIMGIVGNLRTMQLEELLQWLSQSKKSGTLEIVHGKVEKKIFFKDGLILSSASNKPEEYLGHFLMSHGLINEGQLNQAVELQEKSRMLLGIILVNNGAIAERDLARMLRLKAEESIYDIFSWAEGDFRFLDDVLPDSAMVPMRMDVTGIVMEGVQRVDEWRRIRQVIPHEQMIPVALVDLSTVPGLGPGEQRLLGLINDERSIEEIRQQTHATEYQTCKLVFDQWQLGRVKLIKLRGGRPPGPPPPRPGGRAPRPGPGSRGPGDDRRGEPDPGRPRLPVAGGFRRRATPPAGGAGPGAGEPGHPGEPERGREAHPRADRALRRHPGVHPPGDRHHGAAHLLESLPPGGVHADADQRRLRHPVDPQDHADAAARRPDAVLEAGDGRLHPPAAAAQSHGRHAGRDPVASRPARPSRSRSAPTLPSAPRPSPRGSSARSPAA